MKNYKIKKPNFEEVITSLYSIKNHVMLMAEYIDELTENQINDKLNEITEQSKNTNKSFNIIKSAIIDYESLCLSYDALEMDCSK